MKICIVSASHDRAPMPASAVAEGQAAGAEAVIHCGDLISANTLRPLLADLSRAPYEIRHLAA